MMTELEIVRNRMDCYREALYLARDNNKGTTYYASGMQIPLPNSITLADVLGNAELIYKFITRLNKEDERTS